MMDMIQLSHVSKRFQSGQTTLTVLDDVSASLARGSVTVVTGASGSGKSTLLNLIGGLDRVTEGEIYAAGRPVHELDEADLAGFRAMGLGFVFQFHHLLKDFTALENVMLPAFMAGVSRPEATDRAAVLLEEVGLTDRSTHYPTELSGGERQRVALARALINEPEILLADEPTGNLDAENSAAVEELLVRVVRTHGTTLVLVTHDAGLARLGDCTLRLEKGVLAEQ